MKRFLIFSYVEYYPCGGKHDVSGECDTLEEVKANIAKESSR
jgi:hypothetical protein